MHELALPPHVNLLALISEALEIGQFNLILHCYALTIITVYCLHLSNTL